MTQRGRFAISPVGAACWVAAVVAYGLTLLTGDGWLLVVVAVGLTLPLVDLGFACAAGGLTMERPTRAVAHGDGRAVVRRTGVPRVEGAIAVTLLLPGGVVRGTVCAGCSSLTFGYPVGERGLLPPLRWIADSYGPLGLSARRRHVADETPGLVVPRRVRPRTRLVGGADGTGVVTAHLGVGGDLAGVREHRPGDSLSHVHWRSTARRGGPVVREWHVETGAGLVVAAGRFDEEQLPHAAWWATYVASTGAPVTLLADGYSRPLRTPDDVLDAFALLQPGPPPSRLPAGPVLWLSTTEPPPGAVRV